MGWNKGYEILEATVIGVYNLGKLDKPLLEALIEPYQNSDIDRGGSQNLKANDGKRFEQILIETWGFTMPVMPVEEDDDDDTAWDEYYEQIHELMDEILEIF